MKRLLLSLVLLIAASALHAMSYREAREYAYFLTDKMAYELNLTPEQYDRCYEVNLDYLLAVDNRYDIFGNYWSFRDTDLRYILFDWQYALYRTADYFFRPLSWSRNRFVFSIYTRYTRPDYFYYDRPDVYMSYSGTRWAQRRPGTLSPYRDMVFSGRKGGMRDNYAPGDYGYNYNNGYRYNEDYDYNDYYGYRNNYGNSYGGRYEGTGRYGSGNRYEGAYGNNYNNGNRYEGSGRYGGSNGYTYGNTYSTPSRQEADTPTHRNDNQGFNSHNGGFDSSTIVRGNRGNGFNDNSGFNSNSGSNRSTFTPDNSRQSRPNTNVPQQQAGSTRNVGGVQIIGGRR